MEVYLVTFGAIILAVLAMAVVRGKALQSWRIGDPNGHGMEDTLHDAMGRVPPHDVDRARLVVVGGAVATPDPGSRRFVQSREDCLEHWKVHGFHNGSAFPPRSESCSLSRRRERLS